jgi:hypothetical protein
VKGLRAAFAPHLPVVASAVALGRGGWKDLSASSSIHGSSLFCIYDFCENFCKIFVMFVNFREQIFRENENKLCENGKTKFSFQP